MKFKVYVDRQKQEDFQRTSSCYTNWTEIATVNSREDASVMAAMLLKDSSVWAVRIFEV